MCRTLAACSLALPAACPGSRDLRDCGAVRRAGRFFRRTHTASIHLTLKGHTSLAGGSPLVATRSLPMDTQAIRAQMPTLVVGHVPSNVRSFKFNIFDGQPKVSTLGFHIDPKPFEGKVIATTDEAIVVKTG
ncbi:MAG TPA: GTPase, partial [Rubrivivax sp.]|nr:GTPase [Rubrivivax sp.]